MMFSFMLTDESNQYDTASNNTMLFSPNIKRWYSRNARISIVMEMGGSRRRQAATVMAAFFYYLALF